MLGPARKCFFEGCWILLDGDLQTVLLGGLKREMSKACIDRSDSLIFQHKRRPCAIGFTYTSSEVHFRSTESQTFYRSIMTADDSINCRCANSGMTGQVGGFKIAGFLCKRFLPFFPTPSPLFFGRSLTLFPRSLLLNCMKTLVTQAT